MIVVPLLFSWNIPTCKTSFPPWLAMSLEKNFWWSSLCTFWSIAFSWDRFLPSCYARCYWWWWWCFWSWKQAAKEVHPVMSWHFSFFLCSADVFSWRLFEFPLLLLHSGSFGAVPSVVMINMLWPLTEVSQNSRMVVVDGRCSLFCWVWVVSTLRTDT